MGLRISSNFQRMSKIYANVLQKNLLTEKNEESKDEENNVGKFELYGLDKNENEKVVKNSVSFYDDIEEDKIRKKVKEQQSLSVTSLPPPPVELQTTYLQSFISSNNVPTTTSSSSTATTCRLNSSHKELSHNSPIQNKNNKNLQEHQDLQKTINTTDEFQISYNWNDNEKQTFGSDIMHRNRNHYVKQAKFGLKENRTMISNQSLSQTHHKVATPIEEKAFKFDHLRNINPKRLKVNSKFFCRVHDTINENGAFWLEVMYSKDDEIKFNEFFKMFRICTQMRKKPTHIFTNMHVSALYNSEWYRAIIIDEFDDSGRCKHDPLVKVRFVDIGITKKVNYESEIREIDETFFNCPLKALHCTIRLNHNVELTRDSRKLFRQLVSDKTLIAQVVELNNNSEELCKIILGCKLRNGYINIYWHILSKFNRIEYERVKLLNNCNKRPQYLEVASSMPAETTTTYSALTSDKTYDVLRSDEIDHMDTLNEESFGTLSTNSTKLDSNNSFNEQIRHYKDIKYSHAILSHNIEERNDSIHFDNNNNNVDDISEQYIDEEDDNIELSK